MKNKLIIIGRVLVLCVLLLVVFYLFFLRSKYNLYSVESGSMEPFIKTGSLIVVENKKDHAVGDIVTFLDTQNPNVTITHRIVDIKQKGNRTFYVTKGDANNSSDIEERVRENAIGVVKYKLPYLGYLISFAKTKEGLLLLLLLPGSIIIYSELMTIVAEFKRIIANRKQPKLKVKKEKNKA